MAESLLPLKVDVPTSISEACQSEVELLLGGWPEKIEETIKVFEYLSMILIRR